MEGPPCLHVFMLEELFPPAASAADRYRESDDVHNRQVMSQVWRQLPEDILRTILLWLPFASQSRCRQVCRAWRALLSSRAFQDRSAAIAFSSGRHTCGIVHSDALHVPSAPAMTDDLQVPYKVHRVSLAGLPRELRRRPRDADYVYGGRTLMYEKGLLLLATVDRATMGPTQQEQDEKEAEFWERRFRPGERCAAVKACVLNPLTGAWRGLPTLYVGAEAVPCTCLSWVGADPDGFEVSVVKKGTWQVFWVYSSAAGAWSRPAACGAGGGGGGEASGGEESESRGRERLPPFDRAQRFHRHVVDPEGEVLLIPELPDTCEVWGVHVHGSRRCWELVSALPREMLDKVTGGGDEQGGSRSGEEGALKHKVVEREQGMGKPGQYDHVYVSSTQRVGDVIFLTLEGLGEFEKQVVAYHVAKRAWQIILCHHPPPGHAYGRDPQEEWVHLGFHKSWQRVLVETEDAYGGAGLEFVQLSGHVV